MREVGYRLVSEDLFDPSDVECSNRGLTPSARRFSRKDIMENFQGGVHLFGGDAQRRAEANGAFAAAQQQQAAVERRLDHFIAHGRIEFLRIVVL